MPLCKCACFKGSRVNLGSNKLNYHKPWSSCKSSDFGVQQPVSNPSWFNLLITSLWPCRNSVNSPSFYFIISKKKPTGIITVPFHRVIMRISWNIVCKTLSTWHPVGIQLVLTMWKKSYKTSFYPFTFYLEYAGPRMICKKLEHSCDMWWNPISMAWRWVLATRKYI